MNKIQHYDQIFILILINKNKYIETKKIEKKSIRNLYKVFIHIYMDSSFYIQIILYLRYQLSQLFGINYHFPSDIIKLIMTKFKQMTKTKISCGKRHSCALIDEKVYV